MSALVSQASLDVDQQPAHWGGVFAMSLCVFTLIASEFMPVSLLTPIAHELQVSEGQAGQAIAVSGAFAVVTSLMISLLVRNLDRKRVLLSLTGIMAISGAIVALAPNYEVLMIGRALIGVVIGGFWSMSAATAMRLVPQDKVSRALSIFNGGNALATVIAPPLGAFVGSMIGWRGAFFCVVPVAVIVFVWQWILHPSTSNKRSARMPGLFVLSDLTAGLSHPAKAGLSGISCTGAHNGYEGDHPWHDGKSRLSRTLYWINCSAELMLRRPSTAAG